MISYRFFDIEETTSYMISYIISNGKNFLLGIYAVYVRRKTRYIRLLFSLILIIICLNTILSYKLEEQNKKSDLNCEILFNDHNNSYKRLLPNWQSYVFVMILEF